MIVSGSCNSDTYLSALEAQMFVAQTILNGLGYAGEHFKVLRTDESTELESILVKLHEHMSYQLTYLQAFLKPYKHYIHHLITSYKQQAYLLHPEQYTSQPLSQLPCCHLMLS